MGRMRGVLWKNSKPENRWLIFNPLLTSKILDLKPPKESSLLLALVWVHSSLAWALLLGHEHKKLWNCIAKIHEKYYLFLAHVLPIGKWIFLVARWIPLSQMLGEYQSISFVRVYYQNRLLLKNGRIVLFEMVFLYVLYWTLSYTQIFLLLLLLLIGHWNDLKLFFELFFLIRK